METNTQILKPIEIFNGFQEADPDKLAESLLNLFVNIAEQPHTFSIAVLNTLDFIKNGTQITLSSDQERVIRDACCQKIYEVYYPNILFHESHLYSEETLLWSRNASLREILVREEYIDGSRYPV